MRWLRYALDQQGFGQANFQKIFETVDFVGPTIEASRKEV